MSDSASASPSMPFVSEGHARYTEAALRFAITNPAISSALVGISGIAQVEAAAAAEAEGGRPQKTKPHRKNCSNMSHPSLSAFNDNRYI